MRLPWGRALSSQLPQKAHAGLARALCAHEPELLNWFRGRGQFAAGATEGCNNKARISRMPIWEARALEDVLLYRE